MRGRLHCLTRVGSAFVNPVLVLMAMALALVACNSPAKSGSLPGSSTGATSGTGPPTSPVSGGSRIAFIEAHQDNKGPLYTMAPDGSDVRKLTDFDIEAPAWSPDGTKIAFDSDKAGGIHIFTVNADGTGLQQITNGDGEGFPSWSPDGTHMAIDGPSGINIVTVATGEMVPITQNPYGDQGYDSGPQYSPDGTQIAFHRTHNASSIVYVMNVDGSAMHRLTPAGMWSADPNWSPDGPRIVFNDVKTTGSRHIFVINPDGTGLRQLTNARKGDDFHATWSPDGRRILFTRYISPPSHLFALYTVKPNGTDVRLLYRTPVTDVNDSDWWGPTG